MEALYERLPEWDDATRVMVWERWLWGCDCNAAPMEQCYDLNEMHALGLLVCLGEHLRPSAMYTKRLDADTVGGPAVVHLHAQTPICGLSLRELLDQIECLQLHWGPTLNAWGPIQARTVLRALMARMGEIAHHTYPVGGAVLDDMQHVTPLPDAKLGVMARKSLRQTLCVLLALCRVVAIVERAEPAPVYDTKRVLAALRSHHMEASIDTFNALQQMMYLAPGQRLAYRTHFAGMYNCVSQVIFYHHPRYARQAQRPLAEVARSPMHMLPLITQLLPEVELVYEDDSVVPGLTTITTTTTTTTTTTAVVDGATPPNKGWRWLVCCGAIMLLECESKQVWRAADLGVLVAFLVARTGWSISADDNNDEDDDDNEEEDDDATRAKRKARAAATLLPAVITDNSHVVVLNPLHRRSGNGGACVSFFFL
jgi:hypothetical protein